MADDNADPGVPPHPGARPRAAHAHRAHCVLRASAGTVTMREIDLFENRLQLKTLQEGLKHKVASVDITPNLVHGMRALQSTGRAIGGRPAWLSVARAALWRPTPRAPAGQPAPETFSVWLPCRPRRPIWVNLKVIGRKLAGCRRCWCAQTSLSGRPVRVEMCVCESRLRAGAVGAGISDYTSKFAGVEPELSGASAASGGVGNELSSSLPASASGYCACILVFCPRRASGRVDAARRRGQELSAFELTIVHRVPRAACSTDQEQDLEKLPEIYPPQPPPPEARLRAAAA